jgi:hypothetical protein
MARYHIVYWKHIPAMVIAHGGTGEIKIQLPPRFQNAIDAYAMAIGLTDTEEYMAQGTCGPWRERDGTPAEVTRAVVEEFDAEFKNIEIPKSSPSKYNFPFKRLFNKVLFPSHIF